MHHLAPRPTLLRTALVASALALGLAVMTAGPASAAPAPSITVTSTPATPTVGDAVNVTADVANATDVYSYAITFTFDPAIFRYTVNSASDGPTGGFDSVVPGTGTVTLVHTRLGTSPSLSQDLPATLSFTTIGTGTGIIGASVQLVGANGVAQAAVPDAVTAPVVVAAVPTPTPSPSATASATPTPSATPTAIATPTPSATATTAPAATGILALTGSAGGALLVVALASILVIALGIVAFRRRAAGSR